MKEIHILTIKNNVEKRMRSFLSDSLKELNEIPEMLHGMMIMKDSGIYCKNLKALYPELKNSFERLNDEFDLSEFEFNNIVDEITFKVLREFVNLPEEELYNQEDDLLY